MIEVTVLKHIDASDITVISSVDIMIDTHKLVSGSWSVVDDILLWCFHKDFVLLYFKCVCAVFQKYRVTFKLSKCYFYQIASSMWVMTSYKTAIHQQNTSSM